MIHIFHGEPRELIILLALIAIYILMCVAFCYFVDR